MINLSQQQIFVWQTQRKLRTQSHGSTGIMPTIARLPSSQLEVFF